MQCNFIVDQPGIFERSRGLRSHEFSKKIKKSNTGSNPNGILPQIECFQIAQAKNLLFPNLMQFCCTRFSSNSVKPDCCTSATKGSASYTCQYKFNPELHHSVAILLQSTAQEKSFYKLLTQFCCTFTAI